MTEPLVTRVDRAGISTLTINRADKHNALNVPAIIELRRHVDAVAGDESVRCVVFTGAGKSFCAGHDIESIAKRERAPSRHFEPETVDAIESLPMPTIAKLRGHCYTGGLEVALACDLMIASDTARFGDTHGQWGMAPFWGMSVRLPERVGRSTAKELMFTSRRIGAFEALEIGLIDRVVADDELDLVVEGLTAEITANSPGTNRIYKALMAYGSHATRPEALQYERSLPFGFPEDMAERMSSRR